MKQRISLLVVVLAASMFAPSLIEHFVYTRGSLDLLPWAKLAVHFGIPILVSVYLLHRTWRAAFLEPLAPRKGRVLSRELWVGAGVGLVAVVAIIGSYFVLRGIVDVAGITHNLAAQGVTKTLFPLVAIWIACINPFMEEFFWRGFIFHRTYFLAKSARTKFIALYGTGVVFALHHTIIIQEWFSWWQFILVTLFLAAAGVLFNIMYLRSGSILPSLVAHFMADLAIVIVGVFVFGFMNV